MVGTDAGEAARVDIDIRDVSHTFPSAAGSGAAVAALVNINLTVHAGEFVSLVGPSGCGKTTLLNLVAGLLTPTSGEIRVRGRPVTGVPESVGYMPARDSLLPWRTVRRNVEFPLELNGRRRRLPSTSSQALIAAVGLRGFEDYLPKALSQGMRQRVAIARTLVTDPELVLMDEPFSALDAQTRVLAQDLFLRMMEGSSRTAVLITHDVAEAVALSDRVAVMSARPGRIKRIYEVTMPRPRRVTELMHTSEQFRDLVSAIWNDLDPPETPVREEVAGDVGP